MYHLVRVLTRVGLWQLAAMIVGAGTATAIIAVNSGLRDSQFIALLSPFAIGLATTVFYLVKRWHPPQPSSAPRLARWWALTLIRVRSVWRMSLVLAAVYVFLLMLFPASVPTSRMSSIAKLIHAPKGWFFAAFLVVAVCAFGANRMVSPGWRVCLVALSAAFGVLVTGVRYDLNDAWALLTGPLFAVSVGAALYEVWLDRQPGPSLLLLIRGKLRFFGSPRFVSWRTKPGGNP